MLMANYEQYKNSGIDWVGNVPASWNRSRIKFLLSHSSAGVWGEDEKGDKNDIVCFRAADFDYSHGCLKLDNNTMRNIQPKQLEGRVLHKRDLLIEKSGGCDATPVGRIVRLNYDGIATCSNFMHFISVDKYNDDNYLFYYFYAMYANNVNILFFNQTTGIQNLKVSEYLGQTIFLPPLNKQSSIAKYLDKKCSEIDNVISAQQKRIALLQELKQSVITHAVTKGLNPNVEMKDSGVDWIDEIPANWEVLPLKRVGTMNKGLTFTKADIVEKGNAAISYGQVHSKLNEGISLQDELIRFVPNTFVSNAEKSIAYQGDFIFADTSEDYEGCGNCVYNDTTRPIYGGYHTIVLQTKYSDAKFLAYLFKTDYWRYQIRSRVYGVKVFSITQSILSLCSVILPPKEVQKDIVSFLDGKCKAINISIDNALVQISLLQEYKQSLITEVVTGKRKVC